MAICTQSPLKPTKLSPHSHFDSLSHKSSFICNLSSFSYPTLTAGPIPTLSSVTTFAPTTIGNLDDSGFNFLGSAVDGLGDFISLSVDPIVHPGELSIAYIFSQYASELCSGPLFSCASISALDAMKLLKIRSVGLSLSLQKGLPLGSSLDFSATVGAATVNTLFRSPLSHLQLVHAKLESESKVSGQATMRKTLLLRLWVGLC